ncbi:MAG: Flp pilus assembly complex ATPase component TadA [Clostridia bacterium]|nr:Flp pilus assembly complex ATPase component TadA [Clostridia bacterium]
MSKLTLGQILLQKGYVKPQDLKQARELQIANPSKSLAEILISMNVTTELNILSALSERMGVQLIEGSIFITDTDIIKLVPEKVARKHTIIPYKVDKNTLIVAMRDPSNMDAIEDIKMASGMDVGFVLATAPAINDAIEKYYANVTAQKMADDMTPEEQQENAANALNEMDDRVDSAPIVKMLNTLIQQAYTTHASDIHIEPFRDTVLIRMRIDGALQEYMRISPSAHRNLITRIKILSNMNIAEKRIPLDGRFDYTFEGELIDIRVSTLPTTYGEKAVLRLLGTAMGQDIKLTDLGMLPQNAEKFMRVCEAPNGVVLVTGPTGSGKSTTLYTVLQDLNKPTVNVTTIEDPVEKKVFGINQVQTNHKAGLDFASALRSILRQDPDIVMIGEIRDNETADIAMRAAITGHLVLSTLHTNDAVSTVARLIDMDVPPYLVAAALNGVLAQRLVRKLCPKCKKKIEVTPAQRNILKDPNLTECYGAVGCPNCSFTGYKGRTSIHEVLVVDTGMRELITKNATTEELREYAKKEGMIFMDENVRIKIREGVTSVDEYMRTIYTI